MRTGFVGRMVSAAGVLGVCFLGAATSLAAEPAKQTPAGDELFEAIKEGKVEAKVIARDPYQVRVFLKNPAKNPVSVKLPDVLAARPILAQGFFNPGGGGPGQGFGQSTSSSGTQPPQTVGGSTQGTTGRGNGTIFNIPPESVREIKLDTVCLEHGKPNPRSSVAYELAKLEDVCKEPALESLLIRYGRGDLDRDVVQAAAWNLANGLAWRDLEKMTVPVAINAVRPVYSSDQLQAARRLAEGAKKEIAARTKSAATPVAAKSMKVEGQTIAVPMITVPTINARK